MTSRTIIAAAVRPEDLLLIEGEHFIQAKCERGGRTILTFGGEDYDFDPTETVEVLRR